MSKRPNVLDVSELMAASAPPALETVTPVEPTIDKPSKTFRTSTYFHRAVHDVLRDIAHAERKNISDLINEGLDVVLTKRNYPTAQQLRDNAKT